jgi:mannose-6-phosphate isomerase-like protein (cupin superfamily)
MPIQSKSIETPDEKRTFENGKWDIINIGGVTMGRATFQPGWKWSKSVKPIVKTDSCQSHHVGYVISGRLKLVMNDGSQAELGPGSVYDIPPGHDAWVEGNETFVGLELMGATAAQYAKPAGK